MQTSERNESDPVHSQSENFVKFYKDSLNLNEDEVDQNDYQIISQDYPRTLHNNLENFQYYTVDKFNNTFCRRTNGPITTLSINIRGIDCNYDNLLEFLNTIKYSFDVIILTECHIFKNEIYNADIHKTHPINGYDKFYTRSTIKFGGVIIYVKTELKAIYCNELTRSTKTHDSVYVKIDPVNLHRNNVKTRNALFIGGYYRHCVASDKISFISNFHSDLSKKFIRKEDVILAGDFNICLMKSTHNNDSLSFLNTILSNTLEILIFKPTRIQYYKNSLQVKSATLIDQIMTNLFAYECTSGNLHYPDSDHYATFAIFEGYRNEEGIKTDEIYRRKMNKVDEQKLLQDFNAFNWDTLVYQENNIDTVVDNVNTCIQELYDRHAPLTKLSCREKKHFHKPWMDPSLLNDTHTKNVLHGIKTSIPSAINTSEFNKKRNEVTSKRRANKRQYFERYFTNFKNNSRKLWDGINLAINQTNRSKTLPTAITDLKGKNISGDQNIANTFAEYFKNVAQQTKNKIPQYKHPYLNYLNKCKPIDSYLDLQCTNTHEVYEQIIRLKDNSSSGPTNISNKFLKLLAKPLSDILTHVINYSLQMGYVPNSFKLGKQTPVHKGGENCIKNYRPITVCSSISKVLEKIVRDRVVNYLKQIKILNKCQFGFRSKHSTNHAVLNLVETTMEAIDKGLKVGGVFLDIAKAFDTVNHRILLRKLEYYGFRGKTLMWFESYLTNREYHVNIRKHKSENYTLKYGIPQGGVLAPILFILFMNDITKSTNVFDFSMYADDTCLILGIKKENYDDTMRHELVKVVDWFSSNELLLNIEKTDYLHYGPHYNKVYINKGEHDLTEFHNALPQFLFEPDNWEEGDPDHNEINKKGEFVLQELYKVCPKYMLHECITMPDKSLIFEPDNVKYLGVHIDNKLRFKNILTSFVVN